MGKWLDQVLSENDSSKFSAKQCQFEGLPHKPTTLLSPIGTEFAKENFPQAQVSALIADARAAGLELTVEGVGGLWVRHRTNASPDEALIARLAYNKLAVFEDLRRQAALLAYATEKLSLVADAPAGMAAPTLSQRTIPPEISPDGWSLGGRLCADCRRIRLVRIVDGRELCAACLEGAG